MLLYGDRESAWPPSGTPMQISPEAAQFATCWAGLTKIKSRRIAGATVTEPLWM
jgi:hypothetical protein